MSRLHAGLIALVVAGCPPAVPPLPPLPAAGGAPVSAARRQAILATLRAEQGRWRTLTIVHSIRLATPERSGSLRGLIAVRRPDAYRLRLFGPAGITAMDLTYRAGRFLLAIPSRNVRLEGDRSTPRSSLRGLPVDGLARAFLARTRDAPTEVTEDARWSLVEWRTGGETRRLWLDRREQLPRIDSTSRGGRETMRITYGRYRSVDGVRLPFLVHFAMPAEGLTARIEVERYRVDPDFPDSAFVLAVKGPSPGGSPAWRHRPPAATGSDHARSALESLAQRLRLHRQCPPQWQSSMAAHGSPRRPRAPRFVPPGSRASWPRPSWLRRARAPAVRGMRRPSRGEDCHVLSTTFALCRTA